MVDETTKNLPIESDASTKAALATLTVEENNIANELMTAASRDEYAKVVDMFNLMQGKKNMLRTMRWDKILDSCGEELMRRLLLHPDQIDNDTLLKSIQAIATQIEKAHAVVAGITTMPPISIKENVTVNINEAKSNENIKDAVSDILAQLMHRNAKDNAVDADFTEKTENDNK